MGGLPPWRAQSPLDPGPHPGTRDSSDRGIGPTTDGRGEGPWVGVARFFMPLLLPLDQTSWSGYLGEGPGENPLFLETPSHSWFWIQGFRCPPPPGQSVPGRWLPKPNPLHSWSQWLPQDPKIPDNIFSQGLLSQRRSTWGSGSGAPARSTVGVRGGC